MTETWTWVNASGSLSLVMTGFEAGMEVLDGVEGRGLPPIRRERTARAGRPGSTLTAIDHDTRLIKVPVMIKAPSTDWLTAFRRLWYRAFDPSQGAGSIYVNDGITELHVDCVYAEGLERAEVLGDTSFPGAMVATLLFEADTPYWQPSIPATRSWQLTTTGRAFSFSFPWRFGASQIFNTGNVDIGTDVDSYPIWTLVGPLSQIVLKNETTGRTLKFSGTIDAGETLTIDTRPREQSTDPKSVRDQSGVWRFGELTKRDMWPFIAGPNAVRIEASGATTESLVRVDAMPFYLGA